MSLPKVLILNQPFNSDTGGGITLTNLFAGWDKDKLAVVCSGRLLDSVPKLDTCNVYYQLGHKEHKWLFPFNLIKRKYPSGLVNFADSNLASLVVGATKSGWRVNLIMNFFYPLMQYFGVFHLVSKMELSAELCKWVEDYAPDVIYAQANSREDIVFCLAICNYLNKPMVFHMMVDWPATNSSDNGLFKHYWSRRIDREFRTLLGQSFALLSISDSMSEEYYIRYKKRFTPFHNPIDVDFWKEHQRNNYSLSSFPVILYAGRTGLGIDLSLETVAQAVQKVNVTLQSSLKLVLQTAEKPVWAHKYTCVDHQYFVEYRHLPKVFASVDFLILPYDFSEKAIQFIKYSMPTKASEYMISGTPIIVFGPEETALAQYARRYQWGAVVGENQVEALSGMIQRLMTEQSFRQEIANNAKLLAEDRHSSTMVRAAFRKVICAAAHQLQTQN